MARQYYNGGWRTVARPVPQEVRCEIAMNGRMRATLMSSPWQLEALAVGHLYSMGLLHSHREIAGVVCRNGRVDVAVQPLLDTARQAAAPPTPDAPAILLALAEQAQERTVHYQRSGGVHFAVLCRAQRICVLAEDISRRNAVDRLMGQCLLNGRAPQGDLLLTSGRVSADMVGKAAALGVGAVASLSAPTDQAVEAAARAGIVLYGYVRRQTLICYSENGGEDGMDNRKANARGGGT